jgi:hypothetical protein
MLLAIFFSKKGVMEVSYWSMDMIYSYLSSISSYLLSSRQSYMFSIHNTIQHIRLVHNEIPSFEKIPHYIVPKPMVVHVTEYEKRGGSVTLRV